MYSSFFLSRTR